MQNFSQYQGNARTSDLHNMQYKSASPVGAHDKFGVRTSNERTRMSHSNDHYGAYRDQGVTNVRGSKNGRMKNDIPKAYQNSF